ncbi:hypothetical protein PTKIN_Ptkin09bG0047200 [Pterospermum kingtungense]
MEWQRYGHSHPLVSNEDQTNPANCARCGEVVSGPSFSCSEAECVFYLHKKCAEAPSQIHHPFHSDHPLLLLSKHPYGGSKWCACSFCGEKCELFLYHCSCQIDLHIKCALFSLNIAVNKLGELETVAIKDPLVSTEDGDKELESSLCFVCREPLLTSLYFSLDCGFNLHKGCAELPHEINHPFHNKHPLTLQFSGEPFSCNICPKNTSIYGLTYVCSPCKFALHIKCAQLPPQISLPCHRKHPLVLQFNSENLPCKACQEPQDKNFVYCCSSCKFALHIECASPPLTIKDKSHQHTFTLFWKQVPFICDACGLEGNSVAYTCSTCNLQIHKKCISIPPIIRVPRHHHPIFHNYFLQKSEFKNSDCSFCDTEVHTEYGSYYCPHCNFISHVNCATEDEFWYFVVDAKDKDEKLDDDGSLDPITRVIEKNEGGEMTKIKHFGHAHDLILSDNFMDNDKSCDACMLLISNSFYFCSSHCDFFLHKSCSKFLRKKQTWLHRCQRPLDLLVGYIFECAHCGCEGSGFAYKCNACNHHICLRCGVRDYRITHQGHRHSLFFYLKHKGQCNGCGTEEVGPYLFRCKLCNFNLGIECCLMLPLTSRHKCDEHPLALTYHESNDYSKYNRCDICEEKRDPKFWFYHCATCDTSAHPRCVLGRYPFIKAGSVYKEKDHPHPLTFVRKAYNYPAACRKCCKPCQDLALECPESTCNYIVHWECVKPPAFRYDRPIALYKTGEDAMADDNLKEPFSSSLEIKDDYKRNKGCELFRLDIAGL